jgi:hypothetical protein
MKHIYLIRHGEYANPRNILPGRLPVPLSDKGNKQVKKLAVFFQDKDIEKIYSSAVLRCKQTSEIVSGGKIPIKFDKRLLETHSAYQGYWFKQGLKLDWKHFFDNVMELGGNYMKDITANQIENVRNVLKGAPVNKLKSPLERHQLLLHWNFDDGIEPFKYFVENKDTDLGTIILLYWMLGAGFLFEKEDSKLPTYEKDLLKLIRKIEKQVKDDFYKNKEISVDPRNNYGTNFLSDIDNKNILDKIPELFTIPTPGTSVARTDLSRKLINNIYPLTQEDEKKLNEKIGKGLSFLKNVNRESNPDEIIISIDKYSKSMRPKSDKVKRKFTKAEKSKFRQLDLVLAEQLVRKYNWSWYIHEFQESIIEYRNFCLVSKDNRYSWNVEFGYVENYSDLNYADNHCILNLFKNLSDVESYKKTRKQEKIEEIRDFYNYGDLLDEELERKEIERVIARFREIPFYMEKYKDVSDEEIINNHYLELEREIYHHMLPGGVNYLKEAIEQGSSLKFICN